MKNLSNALRVLAAALWLALPIASAVAQGQPQTLPGANVAGYASLAVTNSASRTALPASIVAFNSITLYNSGTQDAFFAFGDGTVVATGTIPLRQVVRKLPSDSAPDVACALI